MAKARIGKGSKRISCSKRYKIEKRVRQHNKKLKKQSEASQKRRKSKKDPGVPSKCPFKDEILEQAEKVKAIREKERQEKMDRRKKNREKAVNEKRNLAGIISDAAKRNADYERMQSFVEEKSKEFTGGKPVENSLKAFYSEVKKVIEAADIVIEVLDARDPLGSRCAQMEDAVLSSDTNKKLILLLNKIDLVPKDNVERWLKYLRNEFPTVAFKASTQTQTNRLSQSRVSVEMATDDLRKSSHCLGVEALMNLLANYCRNQNLKTSITIGIVGFPNTGKSSVINSLKRSKACNVGATPGVTKTAQTIQLDKHIKLIDSPGIVMATDMSDETVILRNCVKLESIEDPVQPVSIILSRIPKPQIMKDYGVPEFADVNEFLAHLAKRNGKLKKGGLIDIDQAAKIVLQDWNNGKIKYSTEPPETYTRLTTKIIVGGNEVFDLDSLMRDEQAMLEDLGKETSSAAQAMPAASTSGKVSASQVASKKPKARTVSSKASDDEESSMEEDDSDDDDDDTLSMASSGLSRFPTKIDTSFMPLPGNRQLNKERKIAMKKAKKKQRKAENLASAFSSKVDMQEGESDDAYDFEADFARGN